MSNHGTGHDEAYTALSYLLAGLLLYGGLGWLGDRVLHTWWLTPLGIVLGMVLSIYMIIRRFNREETPRKKAKGHRS